MNATLRRLQDSLMEAAGRTRQTLDAGPFRCFLAGADAPEVLSYAVPLVDPGDWRPGIAAMTRTFEAAGRTPRLEFFVELWPRLPAALALAGFARERKDPVMVRPASQGDVFADPACRLLTADDPDSRLSQALRVVYRAFDLSPPESEAGAVGNLRADFGSGLRMAALMEDGLPVAVASLVGNATTAELAGVATLPEHRRKGYARRLCRYLLSVFQEAGGDTVWLSAGGSEAQALYAALGFRMAGTQVNFRGRVPGGVRQGSGKNMPTL